MNGRGNAKERDGRNGTAKTQAAGEHAGLTDRLTDRLTDERHDGRMAASLDSLGWPDGRMNRTAPGQRQYCLESGGNDAKKKTAALNRPRDARRFPAGPAIQARRRMTRGTCRRGAAQSGAPCLTRMQCRQLLAAVCGLVPHKPCLPRACRQLRCSGCTRDRAATVPREHAGSPPRTGHAGTARPCRMQQPHGDSPSQAHAPGLPTKPPPGPPPKSPPWPPPETALQRRLSRDSAGDSAGDSAPKPVPGRRRPTRSLADPLPETPPGNPPQRRPTNIHRRIQLSRHGLSRRCARPRRCPGIAGSGVAPALPVQVLLRHCRFRRCLFRHDPRTASDVTGPAVFPA